MLSVITEVTKLMYGLHVIAVLGPPPCVFLGVFLIFLTLITKETKETNDRVLLGALLFG